MILNLDTIPLEELEKMLQSQPKTLEAEALKHRKKQNTSQQEEQEYRTMQAGITESILAIKRTIARRKSLAWREAEKGLRHQAQALIGRVHSGCKTDNEWLALEEEVHAFFKTLPKELWVIADEMFIEDGAGEILYMICSGIRYENSTKSMTDQL